MSNTTYLAFDYGTKRIGVAVGRSRSGHADGLETVAVHRGQPDWPHIGRLIAEWRPDELVVGLPLNMDDSENEITPLARRFGNQLHGRYNLPVHMVDERLTTRAAYDDMVAAGLREHRRRDTADRFAARHILQTYLNDKTAHDRH